MGCRKEPSAHNHLADRLFLAPIFFPSHYSPPVEDSCFRTTSKHFNVFKSTTVFKLDLKKTVFLSLMRSLICVSGHAPLWPPSTKGQALLHNDLEENRTEPGHWSQNCQAPLLLLHNPTSDLHTNGLSM